MKFSLLFSTIILLSSSILSAQDKKPRTEAKSQETVFAIDEILSTVPAKVFSTCLIAYTKANSGTKRVFNLVCDGKAIVNNSVIKHLAPKVAERWGLEAFIPITQIPPLFF